MAGTRLETVAETDSHKTFVLTSLLESEKYLKLSALKDGGTDPSRIEEGNPSLWTSASGLVGYWPMDEGTGTTTQDLSGNNNIGTLTNGPTWTASSSCKVGQCLSFDGVNDYVIGSQNLGIYGDPSFTMSGWMKWTGASWLSEWPSFMGNNSTGTANQGLSFTVSGGRPAVDFWSSRIRATNALSVNNWYFVVGTKTPGTKVATTKIYVNGELIASSLENLDSAPNIINAPFVLGRLDGTRWFQGLVDDPRFYDRALTEVEIKAIYTSQKKF